MEKFVWQSLDGCDIKFSMCTLYDISFISLSHVVVDMEAKASTDNQTHYSCTTRKGLIKTRRKVHREQSVTNFLFSHSQCFFYIVSVCWPRGTQHACHTFDRTKKDIFDIFFCCFFSCVATSLIPISQRRLCHVFKLNDENLQLPWKINNRFFYPVNFHFDTREKLN